MREELLALFERGCRSVSPPGAGISQEDAFYHFSGVPSSRGTAGLGLILAQAHSGEVVITLRTAALSVSTASLVVRAHLLRGLAVHANLFSVEHAHDVNTGLVATTVAVHRRLPNG